MIEETIDNVGAVPKEVSPPMLATTRQRQLTASMPLGRTPSSRRSRPATGGWFHLRLGAAYPITCRPGTG